MRRSVKLALAGGAGATIAFAGYAAPVLTSITPLRRRLLPTLAGVGRLDHVAFVLSLLVAARFGVIPTDSPLIVPSWIFCTCIPAKALGCGMQLTEVKVTRTGRME